MAKMACFFFSSSSQWTEYQYLVSPVGKLRQGPTTRFAKGDPERPYRGCHAVTGRRKHSLLCPAPLENVLLKPGIGICFKLKKQGSFPVFKRTEDCRCSAAHQPLQLPARTMGFLGRILFSAGSPAKPNIELKTLNTQESTK